MAQILREPMRFSSYLHFCLFQSSSAFTAYSGPIKRHYAAMSSSKVLATLDALIPNKNHMEIDSEADSDSDIEVFGPFPVQPDLKPNSKDKGRSAGSQVGGKVNLNSTRKPLHSLFLQKSHTDEQAFPGPSKAQKPPSASRTTSTATKPLNSAPAAKPAQDLPIYSYKDYTDPKPFLAYTPSTKSLNSAPVEAAALSKKRAPRSRTAKSRSAEKPAQDLPIYSYKDYTDPKPFLVYTTDASEADDLVAGLKPGPMALDIEWRVFFTRRGDGSWTSTERRTAVVQVADTRGVMLVLQIYGMDRFPKKLQELIENVDIPKLGVNILNDGKKLFRDYGILAKNLVELGAVASAVDPSNVSKRKIVSLAKLTERYCGKTLEKGLERMGNWEAPLDQLQLEYAANDVHSSLMIYRRLQALAEKHDIVLDDGDDTSRCKFAANVEPYFTFSSGSPALLLSLSSSSAASSLEPEKVEMRPQYLRAYRYWHERGMTMQRMCVELSLKGTVGVEGTRGEGLKVSTVITYVVSALQADPKLPFEMWKLRDLVQMDGASWMRHREWILSAWAEGQGVPADDTDADTDADPGMDGKS
ncbi:hypothetical protein D9615_003145 [Tricholomella constricta]|uniref:3'-5' exonuclease n=1 Tax=Tricholomella constricta TaxID=117010 RepID=A0A8H5HID5_9AGAR|nr:hypothetical protein D9615_003145 [Tricholomella constricta]